MTNIQKNKLSMYLAVLGVLEKYHTSWSGMAGFAALVQALTAIVQEIQDDAGTQGTAQIGVAGGKNRKQLLMIDFTAEIVGDLHNVALAAGDDALAAKTDLEHSDLVEMADTVIGGYCRNLYEAALPFATELAAEGSDAADLAAWDAAISAFIPLVTKHREGVVLDKGKTAVIAGNFEKADTFLSQQMDRATRKFKRKDPVLALAYKNARIIVDLGGGHGSAAETTPTEPVKP